MSIVDSHWSFGDTLPRSWWWVVALRTREEEKASAGEEEGE
jgi:hypothetical protein